MKIKKFNDNKFKSNIWNITIQDENFGRYTTSFSTEMLACDHYIKYINKTFNQKFETFLDDEGNRFFAAIDENEDYDFCRHYCRKNNISIDINKSEVHTKPKTGYWEI